MEDQSFSGTCPTCGQRYLEAENERLRAALVAAKAEIEWWADEHSCCEGHQAEAIEQIDAALAKPAA